MDGGRGHLVSRQEGNLGNGSRGHLEIFDFGYRASRRRLRRRFGVCDVVMDGFDWGGEGF